MPRRSRAPGLDPPRTRDGDERSPLVYCGLRGWQGDAGLPRLLRSRIARRPRSGRRRVLARMTWSRAFSKPFILADGRKVETLYEAGQLMLTLSERHRANGHWVHAMERLLAAVEDPSEEALDRAARQFSIALHAEGLTSIRLRKR